MLRHIDADFDHRGRHQKPRLARGETLHGAVLVGAAHAAVDQIDRGAEAFLQRRIALLGGGEIDGFGFLDQRADPIGAAAFVERAGDRVLDFGEPRQRDRARIDLLPAGGLFAQFGDIHIAEKSQHQSARDRRCREHEQIDRFALARQSQPLMHAEAVLLVDDGQREVGKGHVFLKKRMSADDQIDVACGKRRNDFGTLAAALAAGENGDADAGFGGERRDGGKMLARQNFRRRHQRRLPAGLDHGRGRQQRDHGFSRADVAVQEP